MKRAALATSARVVSNGCSAISHAGCMLTGHRLHLNLSLAISKEEQLVSVRNVNLRFHVCFCTSGYAWVQDARQANGILRGVALEVRRTRCVKVPRTSLRTRLAVRARAWGLTHVRVYRNVHGDVESMYSSSYSASACDCVWDVFCAGSSGGSGRSLTYLSGAFIVSRHRARDDVCCWRGVNRQ